MQIKISTNFPEVAKALASHAKQVPFALAVALNKTAEWAETSVRSEMRKVFDRPTPYFLRSLRIIRATKANPSAMVWFKDKSTVESSSAMVAPHIFGGDRTFKPMEGRLRAAGLLPNGWKVVPGGAASLDANGNMSRGQITQLLNVLGTYKEAGYNKANAATRARLAKGNVKKGVYGFEYFVNPVGSSRGKHLPPGVYKRVVTAFGTSLKPVLVFVNRTNYKKRLDFVGIVQRTVDTRFPAEFEKAFALAVRTGRP